MYSQLEMQLMRDAAGPGAVIPGVDTQTGNQLPAASLVKAETLGTQNGVVYDAYNHRIIVSKDGVNLNGIDFGNNQLLIKSNNVTVTNCTFEPTSQYYSVMNNGSNTTVQNCTFTGPTFNAAVGFHCRWQLDHHQGQFVHRLALRRDHPRGRRRDRQLFLKRRLSGGRPCRRHLGGVDDRPGDHHRQFHRLDTKCRRHDGLWSGPGPPHHEREGSTSNVTASGNYLLGGSYTMQVGLATGAPEIMSNISIAGNYIGFGNSGAIYPNSPSSVTYSDNVVFDWRNSDYSTTALAAYKASGIMSRYPSIATIYGSPNYNLFATPGVATNFVGGFSNQRMYSSTGAEHLHRTRDFGLLDHDDVFTRCARRFRPGQGRHRSQPDRCEHVGGRGAEFRLHRQRPVQRHGRTSPLVYSGGQTYVQAKLAGETSADLAFSSPTLLSR